MDASCHLYKFCSQITTWFQLSMGPTPQVTPENLKIIKFLWGGRVWWLITYATWNFFKHEIPVWYSLNAESKGYITMYNVHRFGQDRQGVTTPLAEVMNKT